MMTKETFLNHFKRDTGPNATKALVVKDEEIFLRRISWQEKKALSKAVSEDKKDVHTAMILVALSDENGNRILSDADEPIIDALYPEDVEDIFEAAWNFNAMGRKERDLLKKSSEPGETTGSSSTCA